MTALSELLQASNTTNLSARTIARTAREFGFSLNHDTAARYLRGNHGTPDESTLQALSKVLKVPMTKLRTAAALPNEVTEPYRPPAESSRLNRRQRRAVDEVIRAMLQPATTKPVAELDSKRAAKAAPKAPSKTAAKAAPKTAAPKAARRGSVEPPQR
jgi:transcriptional regulator with XRE-family HTH domain